jgi:glycosyltransferase involved in cell wall biosynthesis
VPADLPWRKCPRESLIVFGTVGRIDPIKNQAALIDAFADLTQNDRHKHSGFRLIVAGDGPGSGALRELARRRCPEQSVWFAGVRDDVPALMRAMDVFVLPSRNEGISNTILEAMASARPVVAARVGGNAELVVDGVSGTLYDPVAAEPLTAALAAYAGSSRLRCEHGIAGRRLACDRFSLETMVVRYEKFYDELVGRAAA